MNFIAICLHCLDMRDFHSDLRHTPFLDSLRFKSFFIPMGRAQGHHQGDSLNAEMTGVWTARQSDSVLDRSGYHVPQKSHLPRTVIEYLSEGGYDIFTGIAFAHGIGTWAVQGGMRNVWLKDAPERLNQFNLPKKMDLKEWLDRILKAKKFYAHIFLRETHRPWAQEKELYALLGLRSNVWRWFRKISHKSNYWPYDAHCARIAAIEKPDEFAALRRNGLALADRKIAEIFNATKHIANTTYIIYSNHGEVFDHFRYNQPYRYSTVNGLKMIEGTSHGNYPYEVVYANMQMWIIPGHSPRTVGGIGRLIDYTPTILDLAGIEATALDGESMLSDFSDGVFPDRDRYAESPISDGCLSMVRKDGYKLIAAAASAKEDKAFALRGFENHNLAVFDLKADPYEYVNLIHTPQGQEVLGWAINRHKELKKASP
jgi:hypothetical protein